MKQEIYSFNLRDSIKSFETLPKVFKLLWNVNKTYIFLITIISIINGLIPALSILATQYLLNAIQVSVGKGFSYVLYPLIIYLLLNLGGYVLNQLSDYLQSIFNIDIRYKISIMMLNKSKDLSLSDFENSEVYDSLRRAQNGATESPYAFFSIVLNLISHFILLLSSIAIVVYWKPWIALLILIVPILSTFYMAKISHIQYKVEFERAGKKRKTWYINYLMTNDIACKEIKIYNLGEYLINSYKELYNNFIKTDKELIRKSTIASFIFGILEQTLGGVILFIIINSAYIGEILIGSTVAYIRSITNIKGSMQGLLGSIAAIYQNNLQIKQLFDFLELPTNRNDEDGIIIKEINTIEFSNVSFKYPGRKDYTLKNISFKIFKGNNITLVGENGSGKTTLIKLLSGFYEDYEGNILINNVPIRLINRHKLYEKLGVIFQDYNRYEFTCRENIGLGNVDLINNYEEIYKALKNTFSNELINSLPNGLDTQLGKWFDDGVQLSGGQWQKIAISRACLRKADCFILDEPSSSLDPISEHDIFIKISELTRSKISIFISHRLYNLSRLQSRIIVLKDGKIIEDGTHKELMDFNGHYNYLYELQNSKQKGRKEF